MPGTERGHRGGLLNQSPHAQPTTAAKSTENGREEFAARLRDLRVQSGAPSFRKLAKLTNYSSSTLADATSGRRLPTEPVLKALVCACGADPEPWLAELRQLAVASAQEQVKTDSGQGADEIEMGLKDRRPRRHITRWNIPWQAAAAGAGALVFGGGLAAGLLLASPQGLPQGSGSQADGPEMLAFSGSPTAAPTAGVVDGVDPIEGKCMADARLIDAAPVLRGSTQIGGLHLRYSAHCGAGWATLYLNPGQPTMMGQVTIWAGDGRSMSITHPLVKQLDDYTDVIVPGAHGCLAASAQVYQAGQPVMTASIPCEVPAAGPAPGIDPTAR